MMEVAEEAYRNCPTLNEEIEVAFDLLPELCPSGSGCYLRLLLRTEGDESTVTPVFPAGHVNEYREAYYTMLSGGPPDLPKVYFQESRRVDELRQELLDVATQPLAKQVRLDLRGIADHPLGGLGSTLIKMNAALSKRGIRLVVCMEPSWLEFYQIVRLDKILTLVGPV